MIHGAYHHGPPPPTYSLHLCQRGSQRSLLLSLFSLSCLVVMSAAQPLMCAFLTFSFAPDVCRSPEPNRVIPPVCPQPSPLRPCRPSRHRLRGPPFCNTCLSPLTRMITLRSSPLPCCPCLRSHPSPSIQCPFQLPLPTLYPPITPRSVSPEWSRAATVPALAALPQSSSSTAASRTTARLTPSAGRRRPPSSAS